MAVSGVSVPQRWCFNSLVQNEDIHGSVVIAVIESWIFLFLFMKIFFSLGQKRRDLGKSKPPS